MADLGGAGQKWTRDETIAALSLYCQISSGQMHGTNPGVVALAARLGRTPGAVAMKLGNLASFDPVLKEKGKGGLPNASALDEEIWNEFHGRWDALAEATPLDLVEPESMEEAVLPTTERVALTKIRRGQQFFRNAVLSAYGVECCVTGIKEPALLRASHIVPWAVRPETRLDPANGLCLNALHDAAFDRGLITFADDGSLQLSGRMRRSMPNEIWENCFERYEGKKAHGPERWAPAREFLEWHRGKVFVA